MHDITQNGQRPLTVANIFDTFEARMIGFDRQWRMLEDLQRSLGSRNSFPPFNLRETAEDRYRIELAVAGFSREELSVTVEDRKLIIEGTAAEEDSADKVLHRGIAQRRFRQSFALADHVEVTGAELRDGMLRIELARVLPEEKKPKTFKIG
jgi:molecular chaperone IbpA